MSTKDEAERMKQISEDAAIIEREGGGAVLARKLGLKGPRPADRVNNWKVRGIPAAIKLMYPEVFLLEMKRKGGKRK